MKVFDYVTLPLRTSLLLLLLGFAYYFGYGTLQEEWRKDSPETGVVACYHRNGRPWRIYYDRDRDRRWDMWVDERAGHPYIVSIDDNRDGVADRDEDERGNPLSSWRAGELRSYKTAVEFLHNRKQMIYSILAVMLYAALEFVARCLARR